MTDEKRADKIRALVQERAAAQAKGLERLVAQINDQLARYGDTGTAPARRAVRRVVKPGRG